MTAPGDRDEFVVLQKAHDLVVDLIPRINKFPRSFKFTLGDRCQDAALDALLLLVEARWRRDRATALDAANSALDRLRATARRATAFARARQSRPTLSDRG